MPRANVPSKGTWVLFLSMKSYTGVQSFQAARSPGEKASSLGRSNPSILQDGTVGKMGRSWWKYGCLSASVRLVDGLGEGFSK